MKKIIQQQEEIEINFNDTKGKKPEHLTSAINQHLFEVTRNTMLLPMSSKETRPDCKEKCSENTINFKFIDGCFCKKCGYIFPF
tara:strand:+ start:169 stop:420 length:252 start_codon:yes stop_codon:yes gene_type:complete